MIDTSAGKWAGQDGWPAVHQYKDAPVCIHPLARECPGRIGRCACEHAADDRTSVVLLLDTAVHPDCPALGNVSQRPLRTIDILSADRMTERGIKRSEPS